jgi:hypothetical protein
MDWMGGRYFVRFEPAGVAKSELLSSNYFLRLL